MTSSNKLNIKAMMAIGGVFVGCASNMVFLELLVKAEPGIGSLVTFLQFLFISVHGFIFTAKCGTVKPKIGLTDYLLLVIMFYITNVCNNMAFDFNIPVPLHMIFRAGSLIANMIMGIIILGKKYTFSKYLSVLMITIGICISTIVSSGTKTASCTNCDPEVKENAEQEFETRWVLGITLLSIALFVSARMGIYQEWLYKHYGKHPEEALFYTHLMSLPGFAVLYSNIYDHINISTNSAPFEIPVLGLGIPVLWVYLLGNVLTQYICISSVYVLTTECSSLTVTLVITLRKFFSLLFSIVYFKNPFTLAHWIGTSLVFGGTFIFTELPQKIHQSMGASKTKVKAQ